MNGKDFKDWLDKAYSPAPATPRDEREKLFSRIDRLTQRLKREERLGLIFCLASIALAIFTIATSSRMISENSVTNYHKENELSEKSELDRDYDVSLETFDKILNATRSM